MWIFPRVTRRKLENPEMLSSNSDLSFANCPNKPDLNSTDIHTINEKFINVFSIRATASVVDFSYQS
jgi:hypothetical protein